jgi:hypothetical protein
MTRKTGWEEPTTGPDWMDVEGMMRALQVFHTGTVEVILSPRGIGGSGGLTTTCTMYFDVLPGSSLPQAVHAVGAWPCQDHSTLAAHIYAGLYDLDVNVAGVYKQEELWK